jgi:hemoglobin-like flavoprotein
MEIKLKSISEMVGEEIYNEILEAWPSMSDKKENLIKKAVSSAYTNGFKDGQK